MRLEENEGPAKGSEVYKPATVLEAPRVFIYGIRFYDQGYAYREIAGEVYDANTAKHVGINSTKKTDISQFKAKIAEIKDVTALAYLDAEPIGIANKRVMRFEIPIGGNTATEKLAFLEGYLGKELKLTDVLKPGDQVDVTAISKGKGWAGVIKRYRVAKQYRKATNKVRHVGTLGPWHPAKVQFGVPQAGHMGYNYRTERNKLVLKLGTQNDVNLINVKGGYLNYGMVRNDFVVLEGSIPGSSKRLIRIRKAIRAFRQIKEPKITYLSLESKQGS
ncbi:MAG TPA: 50S ribosomal protein L3, partial [Candidatus Saccharimonadales bacterium]|nr:50S ribosomal protein L3 [Candidatus Saccharimonadales bacterium]